MTQTLKALQSELKTWLFEKALPVWAKGIDPEHGGFYERIFYDGRPDNINRRTRVAARQVYSYALAAKMGYEGDTDSVIDAGLAWLSGPARRPDGFLYAVLDPKGAPVQPHYEFYDHAFALFAYAAAKNVRGEDLCLESEAVTLRDKMIATYKRADVGFEETQPPSFPLKANPHMHMFEACLAWIDLGIEAGGDTTWRDLAHEIAHLCRAKFLHPKTGALMEYFNADWSLAEGAKSRLVEPGHQFEWAWLFTRWAALSGDDSFLAPAKRLAEIGELYGTDPKRGVSFNSLNEDFTPHDATARLWPQTERMKAYVGLWRTAETDVERLDYVEKLILATEGLKLYLPEHLSGFYYDRMDLDGGLVTESAPASTLYHIICAIDELCQVNP